METQLPAQQLLCTSSGQIAPGIFAKPAHNKKENKSSNTHNSNNCCNNAKSIIIATVLVIIIILCFQSIKHLA